jgi:hypothetical protein
MMATEKFANTAVTTLSSGIGVGDNSVTVVSASRFPTLPQFRILIENELMLVTSVAGNTFQVLRGQEGTAITSHGGGSTVTHILTAGALAKFKEDIFTPGGDLSGTGITQQVVGVMSVPIRASALSPTGDFQVLMIRTGGVDPYEYDLSQITQDMIAPGFSITSFNWNMGSSDPFDELPFLEVGQNLGPPYTSALVFSASYNQPAPYDVLTIRDSDNNVQENVLTPSAPQSSYSFSGKVHGNQLTFSLRAVKNGFEKTSNTTITWTRRVYWFAAIRPGVFPTGFTQAWIESSIPPTPQQNPLSTSRNRTFTVNAGTMLDDKHIYYVYKDSYGDATFLVGGFAGGFNLLGTVIMTVNGVPDTYRICESSQVGLGTVTVTVN